MAALIGHLKEKSSLIEVKNIEWSVPDLLRIRNSFASSPFIFCNETFTIVCDPSSPDTGVDRGRYIQLSLQCSSHNTLNCLVAVWIKTSRRIHYCMKVVNHSFDRENRQLTFHKYVLREDLVQHEDEVTFSRNMILCWKIQKMTEEYKIRDFPNVESMMLGILETASFADIICRVKDREFEVHRCILSSRSVVLDKLIDRKWEANEKQVLTINDSDPHVFNLFLKYLYGGKLENVNYSDISQLFKLSCTYLIDDLKEQCKNCLIENLNDELFFDLLSVSRLQQDRDLTKAVQLYFNVHQRSLVRTTNWVRLCNSEISVTQDLLDNTFGN